MVTGEAPYDWISVRAAAKQLGIYYRTLYRRIDHGEVPAYKIGRLIRLRLHQLEGERSPPPLVSVEPTGRHLPLLEAAEYLGLSHAAFRRIARTGVVPFEVNRQGGWTFTDSDLHMWLEERARVRPGDLSNLHELG